MNYKISVQIKYFHKTISKIKAFAAESLLQIIFPSLCLGCPSVYKYILRACDEVCG